MFACLALGPTTYHKSLPAFFLFRKKGWKIAVNREQFTSLMATTRTEITRGLIPIQCLER